MTMAVCRHGGRRLLPSITARSIATIRPPLSSNRLEGLLGVRSISTHEEWNRVFSSALEPVMVKLKAYISKSQEHQAIFIKTEFEKVQVDLHKMEGDLLTMYAERESAFWINLHKTIEGQKKAIADTDKEIAQLRVEFQSAKLQAIKYAVGTVTYLVVVTLSWARLMN